MCSAANKGERCYELHFCSFYTCCAGTSPVPTLTKAVLGTWALPGGYLEFGESFENCALREVAEETGLRVDSTSLRFLTSVGSVMKDVNKHYVTIFMGCTLNPTSKEDPEVGGKPKCWSKIPGPVVSADLRKALGT